MEKCFAKAILPRKNITFEQCCQKSNAFQAMLSKKQRKCCQNDMARKLLKAKIVPKLGMLLAKAKTVPKLGMLLAKAKLGQPLA
jgi:hypothetical protein